MKQTNSAVLEEEGRLEEMFAPVIAIARQAGIDLQDVRVEGGKLLIHGKAPGREARERVMKEIRRIDPKSEDVIVKISIPPGGRGGSSGFRYYTVKAGDTLSKIARQFYGSAREYERIFEANLDKVTDPDKIPAGAVLMIPED